METGDSWLNGMHSGIIDIGYGPTVVFRDPDNMQLEFYVHPSADELPVNAADTEEARRVLQEALATDEGRTRRPSCVTIRALLAAV